MGHSDWLDTNSSVTPVVTTDFWRSGIGATTLPDGVNDTVENISRNGSIGLNTDAVSTLDVNGSFGVSINSNALASVTVTPLQSTVVLTSPVLQTVTLPSASSSSRRIITLVNSTSAVKAFTPAANRISGSVNGVVQANSTIVLQSNGTAWIEISNTKEVSEVATFVALSAPVTLDNIRIEGVISTGQGFRISTVTGTATLNIAAIKTFGAGSVVNGGNTTFTATTTMTHPFTFSGQTDVDTIIGRVYDRTAGRFYEFTVMTNVAPVLSFIHIKRVA